MREQGPQLGVSWRHCWNTSDAKAETPMKTSNLAWSLLGEITNNFYSLRGALFEKIMRASEMSQEVKTLSAKTKDLKATPGTHMVEE